MSRYSSNPSPNSSLTTAKPILKTKGSASSKYRFPQARLFILIVRQIFNGKLQSVMNVLRNQERKKYDILNIIDVMNQKRLKLAFWDIVYYSKQVHKQRVKNISNRVNIKIFIPKMLEKLFIKTMRNGFNSITKYNLSSRVGLLKLQTCFNNVHKSFEKNNNRAAVRTILASCYKQKLSKISIIPLQHVLRCLITKNIRQGFQTIIVVSSQNLYEEMYSRSQSKRKQLYESQNKKSQYMANERQNMQKLKVAIDNYTYEKNNKIGELKREKTIKLNQMQLKIRALEKEHEEIEKQCVREQRKQEKYKLIIDKRLRLKLFSQGAIQKVHNIYNELKYEGEQQKQIRSSAFFNKIVLTKQKFKRILGEEFEKFRSEQEDYQVYMNILQRNLICLYENVPTQSIKLSNQYLIALEENFGLKQLLNSLLGYDLLKKQGDKHLQQDAKTLQALFESMFVFFGENESSYGQKDLQIRDSIRNSMISSKSMRQLKKKSSVRTSILSNKSTK